MRFLALDLGARRTGVAFCDDATDVVIALDTIISTSEADLVEQVMTLVAFKKVDAIVLGLPLLPSGKEGSQASVARRIGSMLESKKMRISYVDERHSTPRRIHPKKLHHGPPPSSYDGDAAAAIFLLQGYRDVKQEK
jgi:putative Holliday junction resolvase